MRTNIRFCKDSRSVIKFHVGTDPNFANDYLDFLGENEAICKTALGRESGS
jgi:hypothetical protein